MTDDDRNIGGVQSRLLREPGQDLVDSPETAPEVVPSSSSDGVSNPPRTLENTPLASGQTPAQQRRLSQEQAGNILRAGEGGPDGRSPDPRRSPDEVGTGSSALYPQEPTDVRRTDVISASREAAPVLRPNAPHFFVEQPHQVYYHDAIVYIEGQDISPYLLGSISVSYGLGSSPNKCDFQLDNAGHKFTLTPENLQFNSFRSVNATSRRSSSIDYAETAKKGIFDRKKNPGHNPVDPQSGGRRFPLHHWSSIFHKNDNIRVWIHNPASSYDEWLPVFSGIILNKPTTENYINGSNTITVSCADIRHLMGSMRVNKNTVLGVVPGQQASDAADPTNRQPWNGIRIFQEQTNVEFNQSFFQDLVVASTYNNPWATLKFRQFVAALTFLDSAQSAVTRASHTVEGRIRSERITGFREEMGALGRRVTAGDELSSTDENRYNFLVSYISASAASGQPAPPSSDNNQIEAPDSVPESPPGTSYSSFDSNETSAIQGSGRIGRMRPGVYPWHRPSLPGEPRPSYMFNGSIYPSARLDRDSIHTWWKNWYNLCLFGTPTRRGVQTSNFESAESSSRTPCPILTVSDGALNHDPELRKYWKEEEVHAAGCETRREGLWAIDAQAVHMIYPSRQSPTLGVIDQIGVVSNSNVATSINWSTRLEMLSKACSDVDYRFWVSGTGDLIFEFAQYDFDPKDYGPYSSILTLNHHLLNESFDEEGGGDICTAIVANGSFVGREDVDEANLQTYAPRTVGIWSPSMASRHGLQVQVRTWPQITDIRRLEKLAMLEFQKLLAAADSYSIGVAFRPWLLLNKPIFNSYRERYALIDGIRWTLPVTAGAVAGHNSPQCTLTLNYSRSFDEIGIPRFITGSPSQPMYFGERRSEADSILTSIQRRVRNFSEAIDSLREGTTSITSEDLVALRDNYNAILPHGQSSYNVVSAALVNNLDLEPGAEDELVILLRATEESCAELAENPGAFSQDEINARLNECNQQIATLSSEIQARSQALGANQGTEGTAPLTGISGVRSTLDQNDDVVRPAEEAPPEEALCYPGDPRMFSAPLGAQSLSVVPVFNQWASALRSSGTRASRRDVLTSFGRGQLDNPLEGIEEPVGVSQRRGDFPRIVTSGFGNRGNGWHPGVDFPATIGDAVYAVADGIVINSYEGDGKGAGMILLHKRGYISVYRHLQGVDVSLGDAVKRHQKIAEVGQSGPSAFDVATTHLHFECGVIKGSPVFNSLVGAGKRFAIINSNARNALTGYVPTRNANGRLSTQSREDYFDELGFKLDEAETYARAAASTDVLTFAAASRNLASVRCVAMYGRGSNIGRISSDLRGIFDLSFLSASGDGFTVPRTFLMYSPACIEGDPFGNPELLRGNGTIGNGTLSTQDAYLSEYSLKGVPAVTQKELPSDFIPRELPAIPDGVSEARSRNLNRRRAAIATDNERKARLLEVKQEKLAAQILLYSNTVNPEDCSPEQYEGTTPRQPGEPLEDRRRITESQARAAYTTRRDS